MWWWHSGWGWGAWLVMSLGMIAFWGLVIWLFLNVVQTSQQQESPRDRAPEEILAGRLARGEIDDDEYRRHLDTLAESRAAGARPKAGT